MAELTGKFGVNRDFLHNSYWTSEKFTRGQAYMDMLGHARWKEGFARIRGQKIHLERGQLAWSERKLAERWGWSRGKVQRFLEELEIDNEILVERELESVEKNSRKTGPETGPETRPETGRLKSCVSTVITMLNYNYHSVNSTNDETNDDALNRPRTGREQARKKKEKKDKKKIKGLAAFDLIVQQEGFELLQGNELRKVYELWDGYRRDKKKVLTFDAVDRDCQNIVKVLKAGGSISEFAELILNAQYNSWTGWFFEDTLEKFAKKKAGAGHGKYQPLQMRNNNE